MEGLNDGIVCQEIDGNPVTPQSDNAAPRSLRWRDTVFVAILGSSAALLRLRQALPMSWVARFMAPPAPLAEWFVVKTAGWASWQRSSSAEGEHWRLTTFQLPSPASSPTKRTERRR